LPLQIVLRCFRGVQRGINAASDAAQGRMGAPARARDAACPMLQQNSG
jgi:hypothetical protein